MECSGGGGANSKSVSAIYFPSLPPPLAFVLRLSESIITASLYTVTVGLENELNFMGTNAGLLAWLLHRISSATALLAFVAAETEKS